jgi:hypothetical protein
VTQDSDEGYEISRVRPSPANRQSCGVEFLSKGLAQAMGAFKHARPDLTMIGR